MVATGAQPAVAAVADMAGISRATAYRYFSTPEALIQEAILDAVASETVDLAPAAAASSTPAVRLDDVVQRVFGLLVRNEPMFRAFLAGSLAHPAPAHRAGRRLHWVSTALEGVREDIPDDAFQRLVHALALATGIETLVVLRDVCGLDEAGAQDVTRWAAQALLRAALAGDAAPPTGDRPASGTLPARPARARKAGPRPGATP